MTNKHLDFVRHLAWVAWREWEAWKNRAALERYWQYETYLLNKQEKQDEPA